MSTYQDQNFYNAGRTVYAGGSGAKRIRLYNQDGSKTGARIDGRVRKVHKMGQPHKSFAQENAERWQRQRDRKIERAKENGTFDDKRAAYNKDNGATYMDDDGKIHDQLHMIIEREREDGSFDTKRDAYNKDNRDTFMDQNGRIGERDSSNREGLGPAKEWAQVPDGQGGYKHVEIPRKEEPENKGTRGDGRDLPNNVIQGDPRYQYDDMFKRGVSDVRDFQSTTMEMRYDRDGRPLPPRGGTHDKGWEQPKEQPAAPPPKKEWAQVPDGQGGYKHVEIPKKKPPTREDQGGGAPAEDVPVGPSDEGGGAPADDVPVGPSDEGGGAPADDVPEGPSDEGGPDVAEPMPSGPSDQGGGWDALTPDGPMMPDRTNAILRTKGPTKGVNMESARADLRQNKPQGPGPQQRPMKDWEVRQQNRQAKKEARDLRKAARDDPQLAQELRQQAKQQKGLKPHEQRKVDREQRKAQRDEERTERDARKAERQGTTREQRQADRARERNIEKAQKDGTFDGKRDAFNKGSKTHQMDERGKIAPRGPVNPPAQDPAKQQNATPAGPKPAQPQGAPTPPTDQKPAQPQGAPAPSAGQKLAQPLGAPISPPGQKTTQPQGGSTTPAAATPNPATGGGSPMAPAGKAATAPANTGKAAAPTSAPAPVERTPSRIMGENNQWQSRDEYYKKAEARQGESNQYSDVAKQGEEGREAPPPAPSNAMFKTDSGKWQTRDEFFGEAAQRHKRSNLFGDYKPEPTAKVPDVRPKPTPPVGPPTPTTPPGAAPKPPATTPGAAPKAPVMPPNTGPAAPKTGGIDTPTKPPVQPNLSATAPRQPTNPLAPNNSKPGMPGASGAPGNAIGGTPNAMAGGAGTGAGMGGENAGQSAAGQAAKAGGDDLGAGDIQTVDAGGGGDMAPVEEEEEQMA